MRKFYVCNKCFLRAQTRKISRSFEYINKVQPSSQSCSSLKCCQLISFEDLSRMGDKKVDRGFVLCKLNLDYKLIYFEDVIGCFSYLKVHHGLLQNRRRFLLTKLPGLHCFNSFAGKLRHFSLHMSLCKMQLNPFS